MLLWHADLQSVAVLEIPGLLCFGAPIPLRFRYCAAQSLPARGPLCDWLPAQRTAPDRLRPPQLFVSWRLALPEAIPGAYVPPAFEPRPPAPLVPPPRPLQSALWPALFPQV